MSKTELTGPVRVRFAPSPTGYLHVGGARTAIYNDLLRANLGGAFILRIEDTDRQRSDEAMTQRIVDGLHWIGAHWDEGPFLQSEGSERHRAAAAELVESGRAYRCFCTPDELASARAEAEAKKERFRYPGTCRHLATEESQRRADAGEDFVVRLAMPDRPIVIDDLVRGEVTFPPEMLDDFILLRSDGSPTYHLSVCCDDTDMRGDPRGARRRPPLQHPQARGPVRGDGDAPVPRFGHLPLILGPDKKRLSKRTGATSVEEFREQGILPQALYNYLALLGWSPGDDRELMSRDEMVELFTAERLNASAAVFDRDKLAWMNAQYLMSLPLEPTCGPTSLPFLDRHGVPGRRRRPRPGSRSWSSSTVSAPRPSTSWRRSSCRTSATGSTTTAALTAKYRGRRRSCRSASGAAARPLRRDSRTSPSTRWTRPCARSPRSWRSRRRT